MSEIMRFLSEYGFGISILFQFILVVLVLYLKDKFAPKSLVSHVQRQGEKFSGQIVGIERRVLSIETQQKSAPTKDDFHRLENSVTELRGELKRIDESIDGAEGLIKRLECQVNRMDTFWRNK